MSKINKRKEEYSKGLYGQSAIFVRIIGINYEIVTEHELELLREELLHSTTYWESQDPD